MTTPKNVYVTLCAQQWLLWGSKSIPDRNCGEWRATLTCSRAPWAQSSATHQRHLLSPPHILSCLPAAWRAVLEPDQQCCMCFGPPGLLECLSRTPQLSERKPGHCRKPSSSQEPYCSAYDCHTLTWILAGSFTIVFTPIIFWWRSCLSRHTQCLVPSNPSTDRTECGLKGNQAAWARAQLRLVDRDLWESQQQVTPAPTHGPQQLTNSPPESPWWDPRLT